MNIYAIARAHLGDHLTLNRNVPEEVGCAEAVSWILLNAGYPVPRGGLQGVNALIDWLLHNGFEETTDPTPGCIITAHNPRLGVTSFAHTGVVLKHGIGSNTSANGIFSENYTLANWQQSFGAKGSVTRFFMPMSG